jgi:hypothetical protein
LSVRGGVDIAYAVRSYQINGAQFADVELPSMASSWKACPVVGSAHRRIGAPTEEWDGKIDPLRHPLVVIGLRTLRRPPLVLDVLHNPYLFVSEPPEENEYHNGDEQDPSDEVLLSDEALANGGSKFKIGQDGAASFHMLEALSFVLAEKGMRISFNNDSSERIATAGLTTEKLNEVIDKLNDVLVYLRAAQAPTGGGPITSLAGPVPASLSDVDSDDIAAAGVSVPTKVR